MGKTFRIFYSIDISTGGHPLYWIDEYGNQQQAVDGEFQREHPRAIYLKWEQFCRRLAQIAAEKQKLAAWLEGQGIDLTKGSVWES